MYENGDYIKGIRKTIFIPKNPSKDIYVPHVMILPSVPPFPDIREVGLVVPNLRPIVVYHGEDGWSLKILTTKKTCIAEEPLAVDWEQYSADCYLV